MPVTSLQQVLQGLQHLLHLVGNKSKFATLDVSNMMMVLKIIDKLKWNMRLKSCAKVYDILRRLRDQRYDLDEWRVAYKAWHAIGDWWTDGHPLKEGLFAYDEAKVQELTEHFAQPSTATLPVILTMTSCKRFDLLSRTLNSMILNVTDLTKYVKKWYIYDDNSSEHDRTIMQQRYPFVTFVMKTPEQKGHPQSMNMIRDMLLSSDAEFNLHIEDDFEFWFPDEFIGKAITALKEDKEYGQTLFNFEYTEDQYTAQSIWNRDMFVVKDAQDRRVRYFVHEFFEGERLKIEQNHLGASSSMYWPHFSFRPGITRINVYKRVGSYNPADKHFEMEYAHRYVKAGYKSAMLDCCYSTHIGRRTYERDSNKLNAYDLNEEQQFGTAPKNAVTPSSAESTKGAPQALPSQYPPQPQQTMLSDTEMVGMRSYVINLDRRPERLINFIKRNNDQVFSYEIVSGIDGKDLQPSTKITKVFETGDYHFRRGIVGCAYSHLKIWGEFMKGIGSYCLVLEDDVTLAKHFVTKLTSLLTTYANQFDVMFLHFNPYPNKMSSDVFAQYTSNVAKPTAELWSVEKSMQENMGSGAGYILTRTGAKHLLQFVDQYGMPNAVDWVIMKQANLRIMYSKPMLVFAECWQSNTSIQSDIQNEYNSVQFKSSCDWLEHDLKEWSKVGQIQRVEKLPATYAEFRTARTIFVINKKVNVPKSWLCKVYYVDQTTIVVPDDMLNKDLYNKYVWNDHRINPLALV